MSTGQSEQVMGLSAPLPEPSGAPEIVEYGRIIARYKWSVLGVGVLVAILAGIIVSLQTPIYRSTATLMIDAGKTKVVNVEEVYTTNTQGRENLQTQVEIMKSREVVMRVVDKLKLADKPEFDPRRPAPGLKEKILGGGDSGVRREMSAKALENALFASFSERLKVEPSRVAQVVKISFESQDPELAAQAANAVAEAYIQNEQDTRFKVTQQAAGWLNERLAGLREKVTASERAVQAYREKEGLLDGKTGGAITELSGAMSTLVASRARRIEAEQAYEQVRGASQAKLLAVPVIARNPAVSAAQAGEVAAEKQMAEVSERYGPDHPKRVAAEADIKSAKENVRRQVAIAVDTIAKEFEAAKAAERAIESTVGSSKGAIQSENRKEIQLAELEREAAANRQLYQTFLSRFKETSSAGDQQVVGARIVEEASPSSSPAKPMKAQTTAIAGLFGLVLAALGALALDRLDSSIKSTKDAETKLGTTVIASVPDVSGQHKGGDIGLAYIAEPNSIYSESIRTARTSVMLSAIDKPNKVLAITSSVPGEGKTTFSLNLAVAQAQTKRTVVIEADMRQPRFGSYLKIGGELKGLSELVCGSAPIEECVHRLDGTELDIIPAGEIPPNPLELILSQRFRDLIEQLRSKYSVVIIDTPPVQLVSDAVVISTIVDEMVYVIKADETNYQLARSGMRKIRSAGGHILGVAINRLNFERADKYYGDSLAYHKYGHKYGYGYGGKGKKDNRSAPMAAATKA